MSVEENYTTKSTKMQVSFGDSTSFFRISQVLHKIHQIAQNFVFHVKHYVTFVRKFSVLEGVVELVFLLEESPENKYGYLQKNIGRNEAFLLL